MTKEITVEESVPWKKITLEVAERMIAAAQRWASNAGVPCCVTVVDKAGAVVALQAMDSCEPWTTDIAINKAFSAVYTKNATYWIAQKVDPRNFPSEAQEAIQFEPYNVGLLTQARLRLMFIPGGYPIRDELGNVIGAVGVSGFPHSVGDISDSTAAEVGLSALYD